MSATNRTLLPFGRLAICLTFSAALTSSVAHGQAVAAKSSVSTEVASVTIRPPRPVAPRSNVLTPEPWKGASFEPLTAPELDRLIASELRADRIAPAPRTSDEAFLRRVTLDLTGKLPTPPEVQAFVADRERDKRARVIDQLLASDAYAKHWAIFWRDVVASRFTDRRVQIMIPAFEAWLTEEFRDNRPWNQMTRAMLTAEGDIQANDANAKKGAAFFLLAHLGQDQADERAGETARVFLGIQIQCAQCHDHPFDAWKQHQFHELAGYYARLRSRPIPMTQPPKIELFSTPRGEHLMPGKDDPTRGTFTPARFLNGKAPRVGLGDKERRAALADEITSPDNFWFAAAFVNRVWGDLLGQAFCEPVDDMGPGRDVVMPEVLVRLAASFRGSGYDIQQLLRTICNSAAYQRQIRLGESADEHLHFAAAYPTRISAEALWQALISILGQIGPQPLAGRGGPAMALSGNGRASPLETQFLTEFRFDPSLKADEIEGSIAQALFLMNNRPLNRQMLANGPTVLNRMLATFPRNEGAVRALYVKVLARRPTDAEMAKAIAYFGKVGRRNEAFEDLLWALVNSTEFQTKR